MRDRFVDRRLVGCLTVGLCVNKYTKEGRWGSGSDRHYRRGGDREIRGVREVPSRGSKLEGREFGRVILEVGVNLRLT